MAAQFAPSVASAESRPNRGVVVLRRHGPTPRLDHMQRDGKRVAVGQVRAYPFSRLAWTDVQRDDLNNRVTVHVIGDVVDTQSRLQSLAGENPLIGFS